MSIISINSKNKKITRLHNPSYQYYLSLKIIPHLHLNNLNT